MLKQNLLLLFSFFIISLPSFAEERAPSDALELIKSLGCRACHKLAGEGGTLAPELDKIGSRKTAKQIEQHLAAHLKPNPDAFMPSYNTTSQEELKLLSDYLYNLK